MLKHHVIALVFLCTGSTLSLAQSTGSTTQTLLSGDVDHGFLISPEIKLTEVDGDFGVLGGGYGGWVLNRQLLIGGGIYTLANGSGDAGMTYGGGVVEYFVNSDSLVNVSVRGLVGGGVLRLTGAFRASTSTSSGLAGSHLAPSISRSRTRLAVFFPSSGGGQWTSTISLSAARACSEIGISTGSSAREARASSLPSPRLTSM